MTPELRTLRMKISPYRPSATTPSWMRAPPPSLMPIMGMPVLRARSMTLTIFSPYTSPSEPPKTVASWLNTATLPAVDRAGAGDHPVAVGALVLHAEVGRAVPDQLVELDERARVEQRLDPLAGGLAALGVLALDRGRVAGVHRQVDAAVQVGELARGGVRVGHRRADQALPRRGRARWRHSSHLRDGSLTHGRTLTIRLPRRRPGSGARHVSLPARRATAEGRPAPPVPPDRCGGGSVRLWSRRGTRPPSEPRW